MLIISLGGKTIHLHVFAMKLSDCTTLKWLISAFCSSFPLLPQASSSSDGPSGPKGETGRGRTQQKSPDVPAAPWPPSQDIYFQLERTEQGKHLLCLAFLRLGCSGWWFSCHLLEFLWLKASKQKLLCFLLFSVTYYLLQRWGFN